MKFNRHALGNKYLRDSFVIKHHDKRALLASGLLTSEPLSVRSEKAIVFQKIQNSNVIDYVS